MLVMSQQANEIYSMRMRKLRECLIDGIADMEVILVRLAIVSVVLIGLTTLLIVYFTNWLDDLASTCTFMNLG